MDDPATSSSSLPPLDKEERQHYDRLPSISAFRRSEMVRSPAASRITKITLIIVAALASLTLLFVLLYLRYKRCLARRTKEREEYLMRDGRLQLRQRWLNTDGTLREDEFYPEKFCNMAAAPAVAEKKKEEDDDDDDEDGNDDNMINLDMGFRADNEPTKKPKKKKSVAQQLLKTVTSGKLLHVINNTLVKGQKAIGARFAAKETPLSAEERDRVDVQRRLMDESVNPLYPIRVMQAEMDREEAEEEARIEKQVADQMQADHIAATNHLQALGEKANDYSAAALDAFSAFGVGSQVDDSDADRDDKIVPPQLVGDDEKTTSESPVISELDGEAEK